MTRRLLLTADCVGGVWAYATDLARALTPRGYDVTIAVLGPAPSAAQRDTVAGTGVALIETGLPLDWTAPDAATVVATGAVIARLAETHRADIVQLSQPALAADTRFPMPIAVVAHSCVGTWWRAVRGDSPEPPTFAWQTALTERGLVQADAAIAPSHAFAAALQARYALRERPHVVYNGRAPFALPPTAPHDFAFTAGRLWDEGKNLATLDRIAGRLSIPFKAAGSLVAPDGRVAAAQHLHLVGPVEEGAIAACLAARPVFVSAALYEPFGLAVLEAALAGCPLVLSDIATYRELWDGVAWFVDPRDDAGFARTITELVGDDIARATGGARASARAASFTTARMADAMDTLFGTMLATAGRRAAA